MIYEFPNIQREYCPTFNNKQYVSIQIEFSIRIEFSSSVYQQFYIELLSKYKEQFDVIWIYKDINDVLKKLKNEFNIDENIEHQEYTYYKDKKIDKVYINYDNYQKLKIVNSCIMQKRIKKEETQNTFRYGYQLLNQKTIFDNHKDCIFSFFDLPKAEQDLIIAEYQIANL